MEPFKIRDAGRSACGPAGLPAAETTGSPTLTAGALNPDPNGLDAALRQMQDVDKTPLRLQPMEDVR